MHEIRRREAAFSPPRRPPLVDRRGIWSELKAMLLDKRRHDAGMKRFACSKAEMARAGYKSAPSICRSGLSDEGV